MKFWKKSYKENGPSFSQSSNTHPLSLSSKEDDYVLSKKKQTKFVTTPVPTRYTRMQLLNSIIHHADVVQSQFAPSNSTGGGPTAESTSMIKSLSGNSSTAVKEMNDKAYQRWQHILQEGLVPMTIRGLGLLEIIEEESNCKLNEEEELYFSSLQGMDEEIQMMAILGRAASLQFRSTDSEDIKESVDLTNHLSGEDGMEQINSMMQCTAMLMFHVVMMASTPSPGSPGAAAKSETNAIKSAVGYDSRVRHVLKISCIDMLARAILRSVESYEHNGYKEATNPNRAQDQTKSKLFDVDEYTLWNISNIKTFIDEHTIGNHAIFGTVWYKNTSDAFGLLSKKQGSKQELHSQQFDKEQQKEDEQLEIGESSTMSEKNELFDRFTSIEEVHSDLLLSDNMDKEESILETKSGTLTEDNGSQNRQIQKDALSRNDSVEEKFVSHKPEDESPDIDNGNEEDQNNHQSVENNEGLNQREKEIKFPRDDKGPLAQRYRNCKFLASRKFELIERIVAIDVVRFLMAEERERKLRENERKEQNNKFLNVVEMLKKVTEDDNEKGLHNRVDEESSDIACNGNDPDQSVEDPSEYWTSHRKKQMLRSLKIAGVGLTLGTVFAVTGGLAAPALAAGIGGLASLTGAGTASSTAILAVLATFKAGAALFGVGGGGLAAYKMKKRTDGLSDFSIRRENIEQYMYQGASDAKMKKGVEAMLPHLHTTVAVSGWLRENDVDDFQLAWGVCPNSRDETSKDDAYRIRQLKRFYSIYNPKLVEYCEDFMWYLQRKQKKEFSWKNIWSQLEAKYGANPDRMLPIDKPFNDEIFLSVEERELIEGVLNKSKVVIGKQRGFLSADIDFNENDEIMDFLEKMSPTKSNTRQGCEGDETGASFVEKLEERMLNEDVSVSMNAINIGNKDENAPIFSANNEVYEQSTGIDSSIYTVPLNNNHSENEKIKSHRVDQRSENEISSKISSDTDMNQDNGNPQFTENQTEGDGDQEEKRERCPVIWDWTRLYGSDLHTVTWESKMLSSLCHIVENMAIEVSSQATKVALQFSVIGAIISAVALPSALLTASKLIDDPYQIVVIRADEAGKELAKCLLLSDERRPVTLVGFSFGARVIYSCLRELARQQDIWEEEQSTSVRQGQSFKLKEKRHFQYDREPASLIADVIFIGLPRVIDRMVLTSCRRVTGGRFINCYAKNDWLLSLMFVARGGTPCGTKPILDVPGVENYDVTCLVETHTKYADAIPSILKLVRFCEP